MQCSRQRRFTTGKRDRPCTARGCVAADGEGSGDTIGARALLVHAKDDNAKGFYEHFTFEPSPSDPYHLLLIMKDLLRLVGQ